MQSQGRSGTRPELLLRRELHRRGLRFRVQRKAEFDSRRSIDIAFPRHKVAVFVDGCFWHFCPDHAVMPTNNAEFWRAKLQANRDRDLDTTRRLEACGWTVLRIWEHEDVRRAADAVAAIVKQIETEQMFPSGGTSKNAECSKLPSSN